MQGNQVCLRQWCVRVLRPKNYVMLCPDGREGKLTGVALHDKNSLLYIKNMMESHCPLCWWNTGATDADASTLTPQCIIDGSHQEHQLNPVTYHILWIWTLIVWWWYSTRHTNMWRWSVCLSVTYQCEDPWMLLSTSLWKWRVNMMKAMEHCPWRESQQLNSPTQSVMLR